MTELPILTNPLLPFSLILDNLNFFNIPVSFEITRFNYNKMSSDIIMEIYHDQLKYKMQTIYETLILTKL